MMLSTPSNLPDDADRTEPGKAMSQRDRAYRDLKRLLVLQQIPPGERLREPQWAATLDVSRTALREALARLEAEGWVQRGRRTGHFVPRLTAEDVDEVLEVRSALECLAVERIVRAGRTTPDDLRPLVEACDELDAFVRSGYLLGGTEADRQFHERLIRLAGNRRLATMYDRSPLPMIHAPLMGTDRWERELRDTAEQHRLILERLFARDADAAKRLLRQHLSGQYLRAEARS